MRDQHTPSESVNLRLALRAPDAATALGIGERNLWELTNRGDIPHVRIGRAVVYPVIGLETFLAEHTQPKGRS